MWQWTTHIKIIYMKTIFKCTIEGCNREYVNNAILKRHYLAFHSQVKKFQCTVCSKLLASRQNLKEHSFIHSGDKPYSCKEPGCRMSFRQGTHLSAHKKTHQNSKFIVDLVQITRKLADFTSFTEKPELTQEINLPLLSPGVEVMRLPSLF